MKTHAFRLTPGQELRTEIERFAQSKNIRAGYIITCVAGLRSAKLRMAGASPSKQDIREWNEALEVVSLVGTIDAKTCHLHMAVSDSEGRVYGGHLREAVVQVTAEIVLGEDENRIFTRESDANTGFDELVVREI